MNLPFEKQNPKILVKAQGVTDPKLGCDPYQRPIEELIHNGILNLNKPAGPTSHQVTDDVKKMFHLPKCGHSGTLDPLVTGVLPIALDKATRSVQVLLTAGKEYVCLMHIHKPIEEQIIRKAFQDYQGEISQLPPVKSAVKRQLRKRTIYYIEILEIEGQDILFKIGCQAGTYIRKYVHDLGLKLQTKAHMAQLVRTKAGPFTDKNMFSLHDVKDAYEIYLQTKEESKLRKIILPIEAAVEHLPKIWVFDSAVDPLCHGAPLYVQGIVKLHDTIKRGSQVAIFTLKNELISIAIAECSAEQILEKQKGIATNNAKVFMERKTYKLTP